MGDRPDTPLLWIVRHGESTWNAQRRVQGQVATPELTDLGRAQADAVASQLAGRWVRAVYCSDLVRALQTAAPVAASHGLDVLVDVRLRERCFGEFEGGPGSALTAEAIGFGRGRVIDADVAPSGGESIRTVYERGVAFMEEVVFPLDNVDVLGDVVLVTHGGVVRNLLAWLDGVAVEDIVWAPVENAAPVSRSLKSATHTSNSAAKSLPVATD